MSEKKYVVPRDERGRILPGHSLNPGLYVGKPDERALIQAIREKYHPQVIIDMIGEAWESAKNSPKAQISLITLLLGYLAGKPKTMHVRMNTSFEDMLAALGSNEPVTIEGEAEESAE